MFRGTYIAGTGMLTQRRLMENTTNNLVNVETTGYKKDYLVSHSFDDVMLRRINDKNPKHSGPQIGPLTFGSQIDQKYTSHTQGNLDHTEIPTDLAIAGDAFFVMDTPAGQRYTKSGAFFVTQDGYLIDSGGNYLMGTNGRVWVGSDDFTVKENGEVFVNGNQVNTVMLVSFEDNGVLLKQGNNLFEGQGATPTNDAVVKQGFVEGSNVDIAREMVDMMTIYRAYETNQRMLTLMDELAGKAVNEIAKLR